MFRRSALALTQRVGKATNASPRMSMFTPSMAKYSAGHDTGKTKELESKMVAWEDVKTLDDLLPTGAAPGTIPTDYEQATGLERFELLGKMHGVDVFDMKPLDASRKGTLEDPILVKSAGDEQYAGCTGFPVDSHWVLWLGMSRSRPIQRCTECGSVYKMEYIGPADDAHAHDDHGHAYEEPKTFGDFVRPEYRGGPPGFKDAHLL